MLYNRVHDLDESCDLSSRQTEMTFRNQWADLPVGNGLLSDHWFKENVKRIITEEELQIKPAWFEGKSVLDAGCGNGRWSYGFAQLGCNITAVDINETGIIRTKEALAPFDVKSEFYISSLEDLPTVLGDKKFDIVFSWGVLHHCKSFTRSLNNLINCVADDGLLYLYLYGRESLPYEEDIELFKKRVFYNSLPDEKSQYDFLLNYVKGDKNRVHNAHDLLAPLINRRFAYSFIQDLLKQKGFEDVVRTINHTELFVRARKTASDKFSTTWVLPQKNPPYWFERYQ
jgi:SAM-dependent methyltransferase